VQGAGVQGPGFSTSIRGSGPGSPGSPGPGSLGPDLGPLQLPPEVRQRHSHDAAHQARVCRLKIAEELSEDFGAGVHLIGFRIPGLGFRVQGSRFSRVHG